LTASGPRPRPSPRTGQLRPGASRKRHLATRHDDNVNVNDNVNDNVNGNGNGNGERCLRWLKTATAVVFVAILVALVGLAYLLVVVDPGLQSHLHLSGLRELYDRFASSGHPNIQETGTKTKTETKTQPILDLESLSQEAFIVDEPERNVAIPEKEAKDETIKLEVDIKEVDINHDRADENDENPESMASSSYSSSSYSSSSTIYRIPNSMAHIGDKSEAYARLRQEWDEQHPPNHRERSMRALQEIVEANHQKNKFSSVLHRLRPPPHRDASEDLNYDIYDCPDNPPPGYPREYSTMELLRHWPPTQSVPNNTAANQNNASTQGMWAHLGICVFDYHRDYEKALRYRRGELPFVVRNDPSVAETAERWNDEAYRRTLFGSLGHTGSSAQSAPAHAETPGTEDAAAAANNAANNAANAAPVSGRNTANQSVVYHRAERAITNQILFRHTSKSKPPSVNSYPKSTRGKKKAPKTPTDDHDCDRDREHASRSPRNKKTPPRTKMISMTYDQWYEHAMEKERILMVQSQSQSQSQSGNNDNDIDNDNDNSASTSTSTTEDADTVLKHYDTNPDRDPASYYYYFRLVGCGEKAGCERNSTEYLFDELPFFQPRKHVPQGPGSSASPESESELASQQQHSQQQLQQQTEGRESLYIVEPDQQRGIHCRFGMPGMIAANHYDASRNAIVVLGGTRRYVVSRPSQCQNLGLFPPGHTSARHSKVDWAVAPDEYDEHLVAVSNGEEELQDDDVDEEEGPSTPSSSEATVPWKDYRNALSLLANHAKSTEVVLEAGDVLYLPSYWFHYIVSLDTNMQCNTRSGRDGRDDAIMAACGFPPKKKSKKSPSPRR